MLHVALQGPSPPLAPSRGDGDSEGPQRDLSHTSINWNRLDKPPDCDMIMVCNLEAGVVRTHILPAPPTALSSHPRDPSRDSRAAGGYGTEAREHPVGCAAPTSAP